MRTVRRVARLIVPRPIREWVRRRLAPAPARADHREAQVQATVDLMRGRVPLTTPPRFAGDSLVSWHNAEFLDDPDFDVAARLAAARGSWDPKYDVR